jgi:hypothetical protein
MKYYLSDSATTWLCREAENISRQDYNTIMLHNFNQVLSPAQMFGVQLRTGKRILVSVPQSILKRLGLPPVFGKVFDLLLTTYKGNVTVNLLYKVKIHKAKGK